MFDVQTEFITILTIPVSSIYLNNTNLAQFECKKLLILIDMFRKVSIPIDKKTNILRMVTFVIVNKQYSC